MLSLTTAPAAVVPTCALLLLGCPTEDDDDSAGSETTFSYPSADTATGPQLTIDLVCQTDLITCDCDYAMGDGAGDPDIKQFMEHPQGCFCGYEPVDDELCGCVDQPDVGCLCWGVPAPGSCAAPGCAVQLDLCVCNGIASEPEMCGCTDLDFYDTGCWCDGFPQPEVVWEDLCPEA